MWREIGWAEVATIEVGLELWLAVGRARVVTLEGEVECAVLECSLSTLSRLIWGLVTASSLGLTDDLRADMRWLPLIDRVFVQRSQPFWDF
mgnify:CR=1 FL=1|jgi:hypothetical protein